MRTRTETLEDSALLEAMQRGEQAAVAELYDRYSAVAFGLALRVVGDHAAAEDVVQEAFVALWKQAARFDGARGQLRSWLLTIVHHRAVDLVRRRARLNERGFPEGPKEFIETRAQPQELAEWEMEASAVREALAQVPDDQRRVIEMAYFEGMTHAEIAGRTGLPIGTVKSRLRIGLDKMRASLRAKVFE